MGQNRKYESAYSGYKKAIDQYTATAKEVYNPAYTKSKGYIDSAYENSKKYSGDEGYDRALNLGKKGATSATNASIANSINSARASGMNKAQSATMGNQSAINTYNNQLNAQQSNAYASGLDAVNNAYNRANSLSTNEYNRANGISGVYANKANLMGNAMSSQQAEGNNKYNRVWGTIGGIGGLLTSDERLKKYKDLSSSFCSKEEAKDDNILKYKIDISKYIGEK